MTKPRFLLAAVAAALLTMAAARAEPPAQAPLAAAAADDIAAAERALSNARAALRHAMASGRGLREARAELAAAQKALDRAKLGGAPPAAAPAAAASASGEAASPPPPPAGAPPAAAPAASGDAAIAGSIPAGPGSPDAADASQGNAAAHGAPGPVPGPVAQPPAAAAGRAAAAPAPSATAGAGVAGAAVAPPVTEERLAIGERTADARLVSRQDGRLVISHDDEARLALTGGAVDARPAGDGRRIVTVSRGDGSAVVTLTAADGSIIRRSLRRPDGSVLVLIDGAPDLAEREPGPRALPGLPPPDVPRVPAGHADVAGDRAAAAMIAAALAAPPPGGGGGAHALVEVLQDSRLRDSLPAVDIDTLDFDPGSATLPDDQIGRLAALGQALADIIRARPDEVFLIEGHTDAPGSGLANLVLSDRRAEAVAEILTRYDKVPPENLVTQGYGAEYLKVPTEAPEPASRRITVRRITPLLGGAATTE